MGHKYVHPSAASARSRQTTVEIRFEGSCCLNLRSSPAHRPAKWHVGQDRADHD